MKYTFYNVMIVRDAHFHIPRKCAGWELAILQAVHGEPQVEIGEEFVHEMQEVDIASEKARLERIYKKDEETKQPFVEMVYGSGHNLTRALTKAVADYTVSEEKRGPGRPKKEDQAA